MDTAIGRNGFLNKYWLSIKKQNTKKTAYNGTLPNSGHSFIINRNCPKTRSNTGTYLLPTPELSASLVQSYQGEQEGYQWDYPHSAITGH